jgi:hypothetical protein
MPATMLAAIKMLSSEASIFKAVGRFIRCCYLPVCRRLLYGDRL